ncbi:hypothetical protein [Absidia glauca]|uniref:BHLH domain-containing protein n=1 Tax=Absidia glauca TaxID=4829 RepID=A0A168L4P4_ABSGL|nr:hypothetical protein [Absidia glauca]
MSATHPEYAPIPNDIELAYLQVVHRHGERTPVRRRLEKIIPATWQLCDANRAMFATILDFNRQQGRSNDGIPAQFTPVQRLVEKQGSSEKDQVTFPAGACYYGQLTNLGRQNMTALGARLRELYVERYHYLSDIYDPKEVYIRSTDYARTQESVQQMFAGGLYPHDKRPDGAPIQIRTRDPQKENMYANPSCLRLRQLAKQFHAQVGDMHKDLCDSLTKRLKKHVDSVSLESHPSANGVFDTVVAAKVHGFDLPKEFDDQVIRDLEQIVVHEWFYGHMVSNQVRRLGLGRLMGEIRDRMVRRADGTDHTVGEQDLKLAIYSGHDTTIGPLLIILGGYDNRWPPFGSSILFELYKTKPSTDKPTNNYVRVRFNNKILELPGCAEKGNHHSNGDQSLCTLEAFKKIVKDQVPEDWTAECIITNMDYSLPPSSNPSSWMYSHNDSSIRTDTNAPLQEPVPFEDFQFSFGLDPGFVMPVPLDLPEPPTLTDSNNLLSMDYQLGEEDNHQDYDPLAPTSNNPLLDENDQKVFSQFLDAFFVDKDGQMSNAEEMANQFSTMYDATQPPPPLLLNDHGYNNSNNNSNHLPPPPPPMDPYHVATSMFLPKQSPRPSSSIDSYHHHHHQDDEDDEHRRSSILQSLDQQKQFHQRLNRVASVQQQLNNKESAPSIISQHESIGPNAIFLQQSNQVAAPFITKHPTSTGQRYHAQQHAPYPPPERQHPSSTTATTAATAVNHHDRESHRTSARSLSTPTRRNKSHKELLTEEEKRSNHIASEQKRRSTIRNGFKDLTDIVPTLKNINNSKSTVLFKAVDYIKYLEKRNTNLRDKMGSLEVRIKVEGRVSDLLMHSSSLQPSPPRTDDLRPQQHRDSDSSSSHSSLSNNSHRHSSSSSSSHSNTNDAPPSGGGVAAALLAHKSQQKQLMALQEQLQYHQRLLAAQQDDPRYPSSSSSSSSSSSPQSSDLYQHPPVPPTRWTYDPTTTSTTNKDTASHRMDVDSEAPMKVSA